jgi:hypothetical protein
MVVILRRVAASLLVGCSLLMSGNSLQAQNVWEAATDPVRNLFQQDRFVASEIARRSTADIVLYS